MDRISSKVDLLTQHTEQVQKSILRVASLWFTVCGVIIYITGIDTRISVIFLASSIFYLIGDLSTLVKSSGPSQKNFINLYSLYPSNIKEQFGEEMILVMDNDCQIAFERGGKSAYYRTVFTSIIALLWDVARVRWSRWTPSKIFRLP